MEGYVFKMYFAGEWEFFEFGKQSRSSERKPRLAKREFAMMESLLSFLDVDVMADDPVFREMEEAVRSYRATREEKDAALVRALAERGSYTIYLGSDRHQRSQRRHLELFLF